MANLELKIQISKKDMDGTDGRSILALDMINLVTLEFVFIVTKVNGNVLLVLVSWLMR
jgi:hypothetical protein